MAGDAGWEAVAEDWASFARSGADVLYHAHAAAFLSFLPPPSGLTIDIGCGEGRLDRLLAQHGYQVVGYDASPTLVRLAAETDPEGDYRVAPAGALPIEDGVADLVVSFVALQDIEDLDGACREAHRVLRPGGTFCFSIVHPVASGGDFDGAEPDARFVLHGYFPPRPIRRALLKGEVTQYHRPVETYVEALVAAGFVLSGLSEVPTERRAVGRVPMFLHVRALRTGTEPRRVS